MHQLINQYRPMCRPMSDATQMQYLHYASAMQCTDISNDHARDTMEEAICSAYIRD